MLEFGDGTSFAMNSWKCFIEAVQKLQLLHLSYCPLLITHYLIFYLWTVCKSVFHCIQLGLFALLFFTITGIFKHLVLVLGLSFSFHF